MCPPFPTNGSEKKGSRRHAGANLNSLAGVSGPSRAGGGPGEDRAARGATGDAQRGTATQGPGRGGAAPGVGRGVPLATGVPSWHSWVARPSPRSVPFCHFFMQGLNHPAAWRASSSLPLNQSLAAPSVVALPPLSARARTTRPECAPLPSASVDCAIAARHHCGTEPPPPPLLLSVAPGGPRRAQIILGSSSCLF